MIGMLAKETKYTTDFIYSLPDGQRAEIINGHIYYMAPPSRNHQKLVNEISYAFTSFIKGKGGSCEVYPAPFAVFINKNNINYVEPDISIICDKNKLTDKGCNGAPDLIVEIVSPSSRQMDYHTKLFKYRTAGVREYWIVDPDKRRVQIHNFDPKEENGSFIEYTFSDTIKGFLFPEMKINLSDI